MKILIFDTETTGLPVDGGEIEEQPFVVQLSAILASGDGLEFIEEELDRIIHWEGVSIPAEVSKIHGITDDIARNLGVDPLGALKEFDTLVRRADIIAAFNLAFDEAMILPYYTRVGGTGGAFRKRSKACIMQSARDLCKIPRDPPDEGFKMPSLAKAYAKLVHPDGFEDAHNALADVRATLAVTRALISNNVKLTYRPNLPRIRYADLDRLDRILTAAMEEKDALTIWEVKFIKDYIKKRERYEDKISVSSKQWSILDRIERKLQT